MTLLWLVPTNQLSCSDRCFLLLPWQPISQSVAGSRTVYEMSLSWQKLSVRAERCMWRHKGYGCMCVCVPAFICVLSHCGFSVYKHLRLVCTCIHVFVRMFVLLKGLAQSRPFVVGSSGHSAQLVWLMDVSQNCISLQPKKGCPSSWCEPSTNVPTLTALNRNWYQHQICLTRLMLSAYQ